MKKRADKELFNGRVVFSHKHPARFPVDRWASDYRFKDGIGSLVFHPFWPNDLHIMVQQSAARVIPRSEILILEYPIPWEKMLPPALVLRYGRKRKPLVFPEGRPLSYWECDPAPSPLLEEAFTQQGLGWLAKEGRKFYEWVSSSNSAVARRWRSGAPITSSDRGRLLRSSGVAPAQKGQQRFPASWAEACEIYENPWGPYMPPIPRLPTPFVLMRDTSGAGREEEQEAYFGRGKTA